MKITARDQQLLSAYLDGELPERQRRRIESRLDHDPGLMEALGEIRRTRKLLQTLPQIKTPRDFQLKPEMVGLRQDREKNLFFRFRMVSAAASFLLVLMLVGDITGIIKPRTMQDSFPQAAVVEEALDLEAQLSEAPSREIPAFEEEKVVQEEPDDLKTLDQEGLEMVAPPSESETDYGDAGVAEGEEPEQEMEMPRAYPEEAPVHESGAPPEGEQPLMLENVPAEPDTPGRSEENQAIPSATMISDEVAPTPSPSVPATWEEQPFEKEETAQALVMDRDQERTSLGSWTLLTWLEIALAVVAVITAILAAYYWKLGSNAG